MYCLRHLSSVPSDSAAYIGSPARVLLSSSSPSPLLSLRDRPVEALAWHLGVPLAGYLTWQLLYWFIVQVGGVGCVGYALGRSR